MTVFAPLETLLGLVHLAQFFVPKSTHLLYFLMCLLLLGVEPIHLNFE